MSAPFAALTVPIDESLQAEHAVDYAVTLARGTTVLHFCSVVDAATATASGATGALIDPVPLLEALEEHAARACSAAVAKAHAHGLKSDGRVLFGSAANAIAEHARINGSDGILICTHARTGFMRVIAGSVTEDLLASSAVPVAVVHEGDHTAENGPITVAVDGSGTADAAMEAAIGFAGASARALELVHVEESGETPGGTAILRAAGDRVRAAGLAYELVTLHGRAAATIVESAHRHSSAFIVMGTHGRSGIARAALGSVAAAVIEHAHVPVVVVRQR